METNEAAEKPKFSEQLNAMMVGIKEDVIAAKDEKKFIRETTYEGRAIKLELTFNVGAETIVQSKQSSIATPGAGPKVTQVAMPVVRHRIRSYIDGKWFKKFEFPTFQLALACEQMVAECEARIDYDARWQETKAPQIVWLLKNEFRTMTDEEKAKDEDI